MAIRITGTLIAHPTAPVGPSYDREYRVDIYDSDHVGSSTTVDIISCDIQWESENDGDRHSAIIGSRASIALNIPATDATLTTFIEDFVYGTDGRFLVDITTDSGATNAWRGILKADQSGEDDIDPFPFKITAVCGLGALKDVPYLNSGSLYFGIDRFTKHLVNAMSTMPHVSDFWTGSDIFLRTSVDWWSASMASGANDDALYQGGVDHSVFHDFKTDGGIEDDVLTCYDVVREIMMFLGCRIYQSDGFWRIEQVPYRSTSPYYYRDYTVAGAFISSGTDSSSNLINQTISGAKLTLVSYDFMPIYKKVRISYNAKRRRNIVSGKTLQAGNASVAFNQLIDSNGGDTTLRIRGSVTFSVRNDTYSGGANDILFIVPTVSFKVGTYYWNRDYSISNFTANLKQSLWSTSAGNRIFLPHSIGTVPPPGLSVNGTFPFEVLSNALPADGDLNGITVDIGSLVKWDGTGATASQFTIFWSFSGIYVDIFDEGVVAVKEDQVVYEAVNPDPASEIYNKTIRIGYSDTQVNALGRIFFNNAGSWEAAPLWGQGVDPRTSQIGDILALNVLHGQMGPRRRLNGSLRGNFRIHRLMETSDGKTWMFSRVSWDLGKNIMSGSWVEMNYGSGGVSSTPVKKKWVNNGGLYPQWDNAGSPIGTSDNPQGFSSNPAPAVLAPVSYNSLNTEISEGDTITSIPIKTASAGSEFLAGDSVGLVNPFTGQFQYFEIATAPTAGATSLSVTSEVAAYDFPEDSFLVISQKPYAFSLPTGANGDYLYFNGTEWVAQNFDEDAQDAVGGILVDGQTINFTYNDGTPSITAEAITQMSITADASGLKLSGDSAAPGNTKLYGTDGSGVKGWYAQPSGSGLSDGDYGDITVSGGGTVMNIDAGVVGTTELADLNVTTGKIADDAVTFAKFQNVNEQKLIGRDSPGGGLGNVQEIGLGASLSFDTGGNIQRAALTGDVTATVNSNTLTIADDSVNNFKLANMAANTIKGNNTGAAADPKDLTVSQMQTLLGYLDGALTATRIPYANDANTLIDDGDLRYLAATEEIMNGDGASLDARYSHKKNASISGSSTLMMGENNVSGDYMIILKNTRNASNTGRSFYVAEVGGTAAGDAFYVARIASGDQWSFGLDNSDGDKFKVTPKSNAPGSVANSGLIITSAATALVGINKDAPAHPLDVAGRAMATEFINTNNAPTVDTLGNGMGVGGAINVVAGGNNGFYISFTTGTAPVNNGDLFKVTYQTAYPNNSFPVFCQGDINSANNLSKFYYSAIAAGSFNMKANGTLPASTNFILFFNVFGR